MATWGQDPSEKLGRFRRGPFDPDADNSPPKPRFPHDVPIRAAGLSVDRKILVALDAQGALNGWDAVTAKRLYRQPLIDAQEVPQRFTFSKDGRYVTLSPWSLPAGLVRVIDPRTGKELRRFDRGFSPSFSPDGDLLACSDGPQLRRWSLKNGAELPRFPECGYPLKWTAWSPANDVIAASAEESTSVVVWDVASGRRLFPDTTAQGEAAASLAFSRDGKTLAVGSHWGIKFCALGGPPEREVQSHEEYAIGQLKFLADGRRMSAMSRRRRLLVWDTWDGKPHFTWAAFEVEGGSLEISEGGDVAIWIDRGGIRLERIPKPLAGADDGHVVRKLTFTPAGTLVTGDDKGMIRVWDPATEKELRRFQVPMVRINYFSRDGAWALFGGMDDPIGIWDLVAGKEVLKVDPKPAVWSVAISPDHARLALGHADGTVSLWSIAEKKETTRIRSEMTGVTAVCWSSDGKSLAWGDDTGAVAMAEGKEGRESGWFKPRGPGIRDLRFSPEGRTLLATDVTGTRRVYSDPGIEPEDVRVFFVDPWLPNPRWKASGCFQKCFLGTARDVVSPDGSYLANATRDGRLVIWEAPGGK
jgi:WD40 repeat protein